MIEDHSRPATHKYCRFFSNTRMKFLYDWYRENFKCKNLTERQSLSEFVAWLILYGRYKYAIRIFIDQSLLEDVFELDEDGSHAMMRMAARMCGSSTDGPELVSWYYFSAVPRLSLAPFLTNQEINHLRNVFLKHNGADSNRISNKNVEAPKTIARALAGGEAAQLVSWKPSPPRVSIIGFHKGVLGIGEDARSLFDCLISIGILAELIDVSSASLENFSDTTQFHGFEASRPTASILIFCMPAFEMMRVITMLNIKKTHRSEYWIGYWPWETTALPNELMAAYNEVDEIWAASRFLLDVYSSQTERTVSLIGHYVNLGRSFLDHELEDIFAGKFTFISVFDFNSKISRKNPLATIKAFRIAFPKRNNKVQLVLKTLHASMQESDFEIVRNAIGDDTRIVIIDGAISKSEISGLIAASQAYVSLHRSEGFGRPLVEAMMLGTPVIATQWSGSADFLDETTGFPIRSVTRPVLADEYPYAAGLWAEPDIQHAAACMSEVFHDPQAAKRKVEFARIEAFRKYDIQAISNIIRMRLELIQENIYYQDNDF